MIIFLVILKVNRIAREGELSYTSAIELIPQLSRHKAENVILQLVEDKWLGRDVGLND